MVFLTIFYYSIPYVNGSSRKTYNTSDLEDMLDTSFEGMSPEEIASFVTGDDKIEDDIQSYGDVWESRWNVVPGDTYPESTLFALAVDDGTNAQAMVLHSMNEVYAVLRENYAQDEDVADDDLIEFVQSQGVLVYLGS